MWKQVPDVVAAWIEDICSSWDFNRIIPAHLAAPISASPKDLRCAAWRHMGMQADILKVCSLGHISNQPSQPASA